MNKLAQLDLMEGLLLISAPEQIVIIVDDDLRLREALGAMLELAQFKTVAFSSAEDLLESGLLPQASCLISDLRMPGMQGQELQRLVEQQYPKLPILLITGHREDTIENGDLFQGETRLFYKPLDPEQFLKAIESAISGSLPDR
jgi:FixJ family two-component response regulator